MWNRVVHRKQHMARPGFLDRFHEFMNREIAHRLRIGLRRTGARLRLTGPVKHESVTGLGEPFRGSSGLPSVPLLLGHTSFRGCGNQLDGPDPHGFSSSWFRKLQCQRYRICGKLQSAWTGNSLVVARPVGVESGRSLSLHLDSAAPAAENDRCAAIGTGVADSNLIL